VLALLALCCRTPRGSARAVGRSCRRPGSCRPFCVRCVALRPVPVRSSWRPAWLGAVKCLASDEFRNTFDRWELHRSARKHGIPDEDTVHAARHASVVYPLSDEGEVGPVRQLRLGPDRAGTMLEIVVLLLDDGRCLVIHSMRMRPKCRSLLP